MIIDITTELFCLLFFTISVIGYVVYRIKNIKVKYWVIPVMVFYSVFLLSITIFPIYFFDEDTLNRIRESAGEYFIFYQIIPFASIIKYFTADAIIQLIGNVLLLSPIVIFVEIYSKGKWTAKKVIILVSLVSFLIESTQLIINYSTGHPGRVADIDDLILNCLGIIITFFLMRLIENYIKKNKKVYKVVRKMLYV